MLSSLAAQLRPLARLSPRLPLGTARPSVTVGLTSCRCVRAAASQLPMSRECVRRDDRMRTGGVMGHFRAAAGAAGRVLWRFVMRVLIVRSREPGGRSLVAFRRAIGGM
eukprot:356316-Chlamydomonas_euryale.AAC.3